MICRRAALGAAPFLVVLALLAAGLVQSAHAMRLEKLKLITQRGEHVIDVEVTETPAENVICWTSLPIRAPPKVTRKLLPVALVTVTWPPLPPTDCRALSAAWISAASVADEPLMGAVVR